MAQGRDNRHGGNRQSGGYNRSRDDRPTWSRLTNEDKEQIKSWIQEGFDEETIKYAEDFGGFLVKNRLTTAQIRIIFSEVKRIESSINQTTDTLDREVIKDFLLLKPKIAYAAKRSGSSGIEALKRVMDVAHSAVEMRKDGKDLKYRVENFSDFFEAILAYHKAHGGREK